MSTISLTAAQKSALQSLYNNQDYPAAYQFLRDVVNGSNGNPDLARWFDIARRVNGDDGTVFSELVRESTIAFTSIHNSFAS